MAHAQKPDFVFRRNERVHLNRRVGRQVSRLLAAEVCASAVVMLDIPCSEVVRSVLAIPTPFASFRFISPPLRHRMSSHFNWILPNFIRRPWVFEQCFALDRHCWTAGWLRRSIQYFDPASPKIKEEL